MNYIKKAGSNTQTVITVALLAMAQTALADGFSGEVSSMAISVRTAIYTLVGVVATIALVWQAAQGFGEERHGGCFRNLFMDCVCRCCYCRWHLVVYKRR